MSSNLQNNFLLLVRSHGGTAGLFKSSYFWLALWSTVLCWKWVKEFEWTKLAQSALPTLAGFSIASFAILLALFSKEDRKALKAPSEKLGGRSPLLVLVSSIGMAVVVQISSFMLSMILDAQGVPVLPSFSKAAQLTNLALSFVGCLFFFYGVLLVVALVLKIFKTVDLAS